MVSEEKLIMVMDYIRRFTEENGYTPSVREIAQECGIKSTATVHSYLERLQTRGLVSKANNKKRSMTLGKGSGSTVPLIGTVTAGQPIFAYENYEDYYSFPASEFKGDELFMLRVQGTSMINAGILDGDYLIARKQNSARNGDIVIALIDGEETTCKRYFRELRRIRLQPENDKYEPILGTDNIQVIGKVISVFRML